MLVLFFPFSVFLYDFFILFERRKVYVTMHFFFKKKKTYPCRISGLPFLLLYEVRMFKGTEWNYSGVLGVEVVDRFCC